MIHISRPVIKMFHPLLLLSATLSSTAMAAGELPTIAESIADSEALIAMVIFGSLTAMAYFIAFFSYRKRRDIVDLVQIAIKEGHLLPDTYLNALENKSAPTPQKDLRKAVLLIALGSSTIAILYAVLPLDAKGSAALGLLPFLLGLAYLFLWQASQSKPGPG